jgi:iron complex outermembrane receptor protein
MIKHDRKRNSANSHSIARLLLTTTLSGLACSLSLPVYAQAANGAREDVVSGLEEITVTAQKREERLQDVPISIAVLSGKELARNNINDLQTMQGRIPNFISATSPGNNTLYVRGFGSAAGNYAFDPSVSTYVDGIYAGRGRQFQEPFFDIARIEVLRGPQGALVGKNTAAGAVSVVTANPTTNFEAMARGLYDFSRDGVDLTGYISGPLTETLSARLSVKYINLGGWIYNQATQQDVPIAHSKVVRGTLRYNPSSGIDVIAKYQFGDFLIIGNNDVPISETVVTRPLPSVKDAGVPFGKRDQDRDKTHNVNITGNFALGEHTLTAVSGFSKFDDVKRFGIANVNPEVFVVTSTEKFEQFSQEVRLLSPTGQPIEYIVGAYFDTSEYKIQWVEQYAFGPVNGGNTFNFRQRAKAYSAFGQVKWNILDTLRLQGSARYTYNHKTGTFVNRQDFGTVIFPATSVAGKLTSNDFDPSVTVQYDVVPDVMVYATYARGSKAGGFVSNTPSVQQSGFIFRPEKSRNWEAGLKATAAAGRLTFDAAVFDMKFSDLQVSVYDVTTFVFQTKNAAAATSRGVEGSVNWLIADGLRLSAAAAYLDAAYDDFPGAACTSSQPATCTPATNNIAGTRLPYASKSSGTAGLEYTTEVGDGLKLTVGGTVSFRSSFDIYPADPNPIFGVQRGYEKYDARVALDDVRGWGVALIGRNLSNKRTASLANRYTFAPAGRQASSYQDESRSVALQASYQF